MGKKKKPQIILDDDAHDIVAISLSNYIKKTKDTTKKYTHIVNDMIREHGVNEYDE